jgi:uncharacterized protein with NRDE domain
MCLAVLALAAHRRYALVIAANRDEYHARPATPAAWWEAGWLAGRDVTAGGTWLGITRAGRWALLTNIREPGRNDPRAPSRGALVTRVLADTAAPAASVAAAARGATAYNGFNLLSGDTTCAFWASNRADAIARLAPGIHGVSNAPPGAAWPKVMRASTAFGEWCGRGSDDFEALFALLHDNTPAPDDQLPATGAPLEWERLLSSPFIIGTSRGYGTRCSTIVAVGRDGDVRFIERTFDPSGRPNGDSDHRFVLAGLA